MKRRPVLIAAAVMGLLGLGALGYYFWVGGIVRAYVGLFDVLNPGQVYVGEPELWFAALPYLGSLLLMGSTTLFLAPTLMRRFRRSR